RNLRRLGRAASGGPAEEHAGQVAAHTESENVDRHAGDDLVDPERDGRDGVYRAADEPANEPTDHAQPRVAGDIREVGPEPGAENHHALEADVHHTGTFRP